MKRLAISLVALCSLLLVSAPEADAGRLTVDDALLLRAAKGRSLPRRLSPPREAALDRVVDHFHRGEFERGLNVFEGFARGYFQDSTEVDLEPIVLNVLRRGFLEPRPGLLELAEKAAWLDDRALAVERHLDQLDEALATPTRGQLPPIAQLELAGTEPNPYREPFRWLPGRPMRKGDIRAELRSWEKRRLMTQEDAIAAHVHLQGAIQAERDAVRTLSRCALAMLTSGEQAVAARR